MWGPPDRSRDILVNGQRLSVRENLHDFLDAVSRDSRWHEPTRQAYSGFIFIDQICIDQSNVQERNHQVCQMRNIYRAARRVIVWLGVETRTNRRAMSAIENEHRWYGSRRRPLSLLYRSADLTVLTREENIGINQLSTHAYWSRLWVVQEVFLARELVLRWGRKEVPLENAEQVIRDRARLYRWRTEFGLLDVEDAAGLNFLDPVTDYNSDIPAPMLSLLAQRRDYLAGWPLTWAKASEISKCRGCEDPRDQVYGLLGLMRDDTLQVDYGKSLDEVFDDLVAYGVNEQTKDLDAWFSFVNQWRRAAHAERHNLTPESISKHVRVGEIRIPLGRPAFLLKGIAYEHEQPYGNQMTTTRRN